MRSGGSPPWWSALASRVVLGSKEGLSHLWFHAERGRPGAAPLPHACTPLSLSLSPLSPVRWCPFQSLSLWSPSPWARSGNGHSHPGWPPPTPISLPSEPQCQFLHPSYPHWQRPKTGQGANARYWLSALDHTLLVHWQLIAGHCSRGWGRALGAAWAEIQPSFFLRDLNSRDRTLKTGTRRKGRWLGPPPPQGTAHQGSRPPLLFEQG